jgi:hypothetical protein
MKLTCSIGSLSMLVGERRRQEEQTAVLPDMVLVADVEHAPVLPAAVRALVSRADQRALAKHIGDDETLHLTQAVDGQLVGDDEPVVAVDEAELREGQQQVIGGLGVELAEVDLPILHFPKAWIGNAFEHRGRRHKRDRLARGERRGRVPGERLRGGHIVEGVPVEPAARIRARLQHDLRVASVRRAECELIVELLRPPRRVRRSGGLIVLSLEPSLELVRRRCDRAGIAGVDRHLAGEGAEENIVVECAAVEHPLLRRHIEVEPVGLAAEIVLASGRDRIGGEIARLIGGADRRRVQLEKILPHLDPERVGERHLLLLDEGLHRHHLFVRLAGGAAQRDAVDRNIVDQHARIDRGACIFRLEFTHLPLTGEHPERIAHFERRLRSKFAVRGRGSRRL